MNKQKILRWGDSASYSERMGLLRLLLKNEVKIIENADGSRINIDILSKDVIQEIMDFILTDRVEEKFKM